MLKQINRFFGATCVAALAWASAAVAEGRMALILHDTANPYWETMGNVGTEIAEELGYRMLVLEHLSNVETESNMIDDAIAANVDAIILDVASYETSHVAVQRAKDAGIPTFTVDSFLEQEGVAIGQLFADSYQGTTAGAERMVELVGGEGTFIELYGEPSNINAPLRSTGWNDVFDQHPGITRVAVESADWSQPKGYAKTTEMLKNHPDIRFIAAGNDEMALGAIAALRDAGLQDQVIVGGFDGAPEAINAVRDGSMAFTILQPMADFTEAAIRQADHYVRTGERLVAEEMQPFDCIVIDSSTVEGMIAPFDFGGTM